ncbi:MFS transporter [Microbacterium sp. LRZ72]|uniref:MFS transporter n=1 Tax=Microbacterium sp. LRZ72 TaxID=2942481 RepID=UPI0029B52976|nr:MFS transporter [Microbacterium sp. LRZ72]MDX2376399.1 MFS transporter [Microbacterium sp. LRZ72]
MGSGDAGRRKRLTRYYPQWAVVAVLALGGLCASFMFTLVVPIQAQLPELLDAPREDTAWVVTATLLTAAVATPISGRLGDMYGKRRIVLILLALLVVGSVIAALSTSIIGIVIGRALQGAVTGVVPLGIAILRDIVHSDHLGTAVALISATMGVGGAIGLPLSAIVTARADWHMLFWMSAGIGVVVFALVLWIVPVSLLRFPGRFDFVGALGLAAGLTGLLLAVSRGGEWGWLSAPTLGCGIGGILVLLVWGRYQLRTREPLLDLRVAARTPVLLTNLASIGMGFALFGSNVLFPQLLELPTGSGVGFGLSLIGAALVVMPSGIIMMLISPLSGWFARTVGPRLLFTLGALAVVLAYVVALALGTEVWHIVMANMLVGVGIGLSFAAMPLLIMRSVPADETGASNGLNALFRSVGTSSAAAVLGGVLAFMSVPFEGVPVPTAAAFELSFWIAGSAALFALVLTLFIPRHASVEQHPATPAD